MSQRQDQRTLAGVLGEILFAVAMMVAILLGVREGFTLLIPADSCAGSPIDVVFLVLSYVFMLHIAQPENKSGYARHLRLGATALGGLVLAVLATRLAVGCTPLGAWLGDGRAIAEALVMFGILIPLGHLHRDVIEPRWARAMGESGGPNGKKEPQP